MKEGDNSCERDELNYHKAVVASICYEKRIVRSMQNGLKASTRLNRYPRNINSMQVGFK